MLPGPVSRFLFVALLVGCQPGSPGQVPGTTPSGTLPGGTPVGTPTGTPGGTTTPTGTPTTTSGTPCESPPPPPGTWTTLFHVPESEEFAFDDQGNLLNISDTASLLYATPYSGAPVSLAPYSSPEVGGIRFEVDGSRLVVADEGNGALFGLEVNGATEVLLGAIIEPNSLAVHSDGWVYTTAADQVWKVDPSGVEPPTIQFQLLGTDLDGMVLSNDENTLYFNHDEDAQIYEVEVLANGDLGTPTMIADLDEGFFELDGAAIDACDNLYVVFTDGRIAKVNTVTGQSGLYAQLPIGSFTTSAHFGSGIGGWESDHLYVMDRNGAMYELEVGIEGKVEPHLAP